MFKTTTPKGTEGFGISYSDEERCAKALNQILPDGWKISFSWAQILFSDVQYELDKRRKIIKVVYNQNLRIWTSELVAEVADKLKATPSNA